MAGRIPQHFIDDLIARVDIVDVIDSRVPLKKAGREYKACCPFHDEKTPSFTVSPDKQFYHCFGCGAHGTAIGFLMEYEHLEFVEAIQELAKQVGVEVPREAGFVPQPKREGPDLYELLKQASAFFQRQLREHAEGPQAVEYLKGRGLSGEIARDFGVGYAPDGWDNLLKALGQEKSRAMVEAGLLIEKDGGGVYDRFRGRVMFPIRDRRGRVIAFGGRVLGDGTPKYLNSPETPVFHKGRELYGLYEARQALRELPRLLVVEGYMDVVALAQFGIRYAVATLGTAVTPDHLEQLYRATDEVVFCFDGDRAGRDAAWRGLENALGQMRDGRELRFLFLPEGEDPDTLIRKQGKEAFEALVDGATPLSKFLFEQLRKSADLSRLDGRARLLEQARPLLTNLPPGSYRQLMVDELARFSKMDVGQLRQLLGGGGSDAGMPPSFAPSYAAQRRPAGGKRQAPSPMRTAIQLLLHQPAVAADVSDCDWLRGLELPGSALLLELLELLRERPHLSTGALLEHWRGREEERHLATLAAQELLIKDQEEVTLEAEFLDALKQLRSQYRERRLEELTEHLATLTPAQKDELKQLYSELHAERKKDAE